LTPSPCRRSTVTGRARCRFEGPGDAPRRFTAKFKQAPTARRSRAVARGPARPRGVRRRPSNIDAPLFVNGVAARSAQENRAAGSITSKSCKAGWVRSELRCSPKRHHWGLGLASASTKASRGPRTGALVRSHHVHAYRLSNPRLSDDAVTDVAATNPGEAASGAPDRLPAPSRWSTKRRKGRAGRATRPIRPKVRSSTNPEGPWRKLWAALVRAAGARRAPRKQTTTSCLCASTTHCHLGTRTKNPCHMVPGPLFRKHQTPHRRSPACALSCAHPAGQVP